MLSTLSRFRKPIALSFLSIFYFQLYAESKSLWSALSQFESIKTFAGASISPVPNAPEIITGLTSLNNEDKDKKKGKGRKEKSSSPKGIKLQKPFIDGPSQPESRGFKSVGADNMVDLFSGNFSYSIPLLDVGGYPVNLSYSADISMDQEASWVGLGWNLNPGTVSRQMRGLPDDFNGIDKIEKQMNMRPNTTVGIGLGGNVEVAGLPISALKASGGIYRNNYTGFGLEASLNLALSLNDKTNDEKTPSMGLNIGIGVDSKKGMNFYPSLNIQSARADGEAKRGLSGNLGFNYNSRMGLQSLDIKGSVGIIPVSALDLSFAHPTYTPTVRMPTSSLSLSFNANLGKEFWFIHAAPSVKGYYSRIVMEKAPLKTAAYGYLHLQGGRQDKTGVMDFNRLNDGMVSKDKPVISFPNYTYDIFSVSGEGTGGSFRAYRGDVGYVRDPEMNTNSGSISAGLDIGAGPAAGKIGVNLDLAYSPLRVGEWEDLNLARNTLAFKDASGTFENVYFRNPAEKAIVSEEYQKSMGDADLVRLKFGHVAGLPSTGVNPLLLPSLESFKEDYTSNPDIKLNGANTTKSVRDKRTQIMSYLTAKEASAIGLDKYIANYIPNQFTYTSCGLMQHRVVPRMENNLREPHHISEVTILNGDGSRHVYGVPVYNREQKDVSFNAHENGVKDFAKGTIEYNSNDASTNNGNGKDHFFQMEKIPPYAHSYLLSGVLSPDYVDVKQDGITNDDKGNAVRFNYSQINPDLGWRVPVSGANKAAFNEMLKTKNSDDKANYSFGRKELWYLHSIESKNLVAVFVLNNGPRYDGAYSQNENGSILTINNGRKHLERIDLYVKSELIKLGTQGAKPVKSIHFDYSYELCKNVPGYTGSEEQFKGKLTLTAISFSYKGRYNKRKNYYRFNYGDPQTNNPGYDRLASDRWGNYKPSSQNPSQLSNADFPFTIQDSAIAQSKIAPWALRKILLPSGGRIEVGYESDDYAFVQNKRATVMSQVLGFGDGPLSTPTSALYKINGLNSVDHQYIFFESNIANLTHLQIKEYLLKDMKQLAVKMAVKIPNDDGVADYEFVMAFANIESYGVVGSTSKFYVKVALDQDGRSPFAQAAIKFLQEQLPEQAFYGYDTSEDLLGIDVIKSLIGMISSITNAFSLPDATLRGDGKCKHVYLNKTFGRIGKVSTAGDHLVIKKYGGGYRVRKVEMFDSWNELKGGQLSKYGQEYFYETNELVNSNWVRLSSGVANYEPALGGEENPFRELLKYSTQQFMGPTDADAVEMPLGEEFFPSPSVGYSRVTVKSINRSDAAKRLKNGAGVQVTEFYTSREFPIITGFTLLDDKSRVRRVPNPVLQILNVHAEHDLNITQGMRVILNDMHGKLKSQATYGEGDDKIPVASTRNYYRIAPTGNQTFTLNNKVKVVEGSIGLVKEKNVGIDIELMADFREHFSRTYSVNLNFNLDFQMAGLPFFMFNMVPLYAYSHSRYRGSSVAKVINLYGLLDSVVVIDKGSMVSTSNELYDAETGNVLLTKTHNAFQDPIFNFSYPAHWAYSGMGGGYKNIDALYKKNTFVDGKIVGGGLSSQNLNVIFESGDELYIFNENKEPQFESPACLEAGKPCSIPYTPLSLQKLWAVNLSKDPQHTGGWIFIDNKGAPYSCKSADFRIVRSGKRNLLQANVGAFASAKPPLNTQETSLEIGDAKDIISASTAVYKDHWRIDDGYMVKDSVVETLTPVTLYSMSLHPTAGRMVRKYEQTENQNILNQQYKHHTFSGPQPGGSTNDVNFFLARNKISSNHSKINHWSAKSWVNYDLSVLPSGITIYKGELNLFTLGAASDFQAEFPHDKISFLNPINGSNNVFHLDDPASLPPANAFKVTRMKSPWHTQNWDWENSFSSNAGLDNTSGGSVLYTQGIDNSINSISLDITEIAKRMYTQRNMYASGLKLELINPSAFGKEARVAFLNYQYEMPKSLVLQFYSCSNTNYAQTIPGVTQVFPQPQIFCSSYQKQSWCISRFTQERINPYVEGVLGNWRADSVFTYYGNRRESLANTPTNIRKDGYIQNFSPFWDLQAPYLNKVYHPSWQWVSVTTQFNQRGMELENTDPLGRYNAGIYGFNKNLPTAVVNNSRLKESMFDSFEDYDFNYSSNCETCPIASHHRFGDGKLTGLISSEEAHTGIHALKVGPNSAIRLQTSIVPGISSLYSYYNNLENTDVSLTTLTPQGTGKAQAEFTVYIPPNATPNSSTSEHTFLDGLKFNTLSGYSISNPSKYKWTVKVQAPVSGNYFFKGVHDDGFKFKIDGNLIYSNSSNTQSPDVSFNTIGVSLQKGQLYLFEIELNNIPNGPAGFDLKWMVDCKLELETIPKKYLYKHTDPNAGLNTISSPYTLTCSKVDDIGISTSGLVDTFSMVQGQKMVFSAWVKEGGADCKCSTYTNNSVEIKFNGQSSATITTTFTPTGSIIEGWQRYEGYFTIPTTGYNQMEVLLKSIGASNVYFDDIRIHPYHGNMKSFVYHPNDLRLMAELDENNYASLYEYDDDGSLVRTKKETKNGIKTITESRSATQTVKVN